MSNEECYGNRWQPYHGGSPGYPNHFRYGFWEKTSSGYSYYIGGFVDRDTLVEGAVETSCDSGHQLAFHPAMIVGDSKLQRNARMDAQIAEVSKRLNAA